MLLPTVSLISSGPDWAPIEPRTATAINAGAPNFESVRLEIMFTCRLRGWGPIGADYLNGLRCSTNFYYLVRGRRRGRRRRSGGVNQRLHPRPRLRFSTGSLGTLRSHAVKLADLAARRFLNRLIAAVTQHKLNMALAVG